MFNQIKNTGFVILRNKISGVVSKQTQKSSLYSAQYYQFSDKNNNNNNSNQQEDYEVPYNYNFEQFKEYKQKVIRAKEDKKLQEIKLKEADPIDLLPRRKRRQYDSPRYDLDITNYGSWRIFDGGLIKNHENGYPVVAKIACPPKTFKKVFGTGTPSRKNNGRATMEYDFEDVNTDFFLVYDWKSTTEWWGKNDENYDYENQEDIYPKDRKIKYPTFEEFWESEEPHIFRVNCSRYADFRKFKKWMENEIETKKDGPSLDEIVIQKFGKLDGKDDFNVKDYEIFGNPPVFQYDRSFWESDQKKQQDSGNKSKSNKQQQQSEEKLNKREAKRQAKKDKLEDNNNKEEEEDSSQSQQSSKKSNAGSNMFSENLKPAKQLDDKFLVQHQDQQ